MKYTSRGLRRRRNTDQWECTLSHKDPLTGEVLRSFHTIEAKKAAVAKVEDSFDLDFYDVKPEDVWARYNRTSAPTITFTEEQLLAML